jgi:hypothetical protein
MTTDSHTVARKVQDNSNYPDAGYPDSQLSGSCNFVENSTEVSCPEITGYRIDIRVLCSIEQICKPNTVLL